MDKSELIERLNGDLVGELSAVIQYTTYAAKATGPYRPQLVEFFLQEVPVQLEAMVADETGHAEETERILRNWPV